MSVLNKMLRDLEQRGQTPASAKVSSTIAYDAADSARPLWLNLLLLLSAALLCFAVYAILTRPAESLLTATTSPEAVADSAPQQAAVILPENTNEQTDIAATALPMLPKVEQVTEQKPQPAAVNSEDTAVIAAATPAERTEPEQAVIPAGQPAVPKRPVQATLAVERAPLSAAQRQQQLSQQAIAAEQSGKLTQALGYWQQLQQLNATDVTAYLAQARLLNLMGQASQVNAVLQQAQQNGVVDANVQLLLAQQAAALGQWQQVDKLLPEQFLLPANTEYYGLKATALQQLAQPAAALHWYSQLIVAQPQQARWWLGAAIAHDMLGNTAQARLHYQQALQWGDSLSAASRQYIQQRLTATE